MGEDREEVVEAQALRAQGAGRRGEVGGPKGDQIWNMENLHPRETQIWGPVAGLLTGNMHFNKIPQ